MPQKKKETAAKEEFKKAAPKKKIQANKKSKVSKDFCSTTKRKAPKSKKPKAPKVPESFYDDLAHMQSIFGRIGRGGIAGPGGCCIPRRRRY